MMLGGCRFLDEQVPPGYYGMVQTPDGLTGELLRPGYHQCYGRDKLILIEAKEAVSNEPLKILCADELNFEFDIIVRYTLAARNPKDVMGILDIMGANIKWVGDIGVLHLSVLYNTYVKPTIVSKARAVVSRYRTTDIRNARAEIDKAIWDGVNNDLKGTPVAIKLINSSNYDYPEVITNAMEAKRKREIAIDEEKAKQAVELLKADNRLKIANKMREVRTAEGQAEAVYVEILGKALTSDYLELRRIEALSGLYNRVEPGDKIIVTGNGPVMPMVNSPAPGGK
jgi:hypothetical protein